MFFMRTSFSFEIGMGREVLYWRTDGGPVWEIVMPFMWVGRDDMMTAGRWEARFSKKKTIQICGKSKQDV